MNNRSRNSNMSNPMTLPGPFTLNPSTYTNPNNTDMTPTGPIAVIRHDDLNGMREQIKDSAALLYVSIHITAPRGHPSMNIATIRDSLFIVFGGSPPNVYATIIVVKPGEREQAMQPVTPAETRPHVFVSKACTDQVDALLALWSLVSAALDEAMQGDERYTDLALYGGNLHVLAAAREGGTIVRMAPMATASTTAASTAAASMATDRPFNEDDYNFDLGGIANG